MQDQKALEFNSTAGAYFLVFLVSIPCIYIPFFGWAFLLDYTAKWVANSTTVNGKPVQYDGKYGETLKFIFVQTLLLFITLGIYTFWFYPKVYKYVASHINYIGTAPAPAPVAASEEPAAPAEAIPAPAAPSAPEAPTQPTPDVQPPTPPAAPTVQ